MTPHWFKIAENFGSSLSFPVCIAGAAVSAKADEVDQGQTNAMLIDRGIGIRRTLRKIV